MRLLFVYGFFFLSLQNVLRAIARSSREIHLNYLIITVEFVDHGGDDTKRDVRAQSSEMLYTVYVIGTGPKRNENTHGEKRKREKEGLLLLLFFLPAKVRRREVKSMC